MREILEQHHYDASQFYAVIEQLKIEVKTGYIAVVGWPSYAEFEKKYAVEGSCRSDNVAGRFLDIPACCAETFSHQGDLTDRRLLQTYPYHGASSPEELQWPIDTKERKKRFKDFAEHLMRYKDKVCNHSKSIRAEVEQRIQQKTVPEEIRLLFSMYIPCKVDCEEFTTMAKKMNEALARCLSSEKYSEILNGYKSGERCL